MESILPTSEYKEYEGRAYLNPDAALNESNQFIDNLRSTQGQQNQEIAAQTYNLGTSVPSSQGGLGSNNANGLSYFTSRYQTPQTASAVSDLRATAQAAALNQILEDEQTAWKKRYNDAYRAYQKSAYNKSNSSGSGSGGGSNGNNSSSWQGDTTKTATDVGNNNNGNSGDGGKTETPPNPEDYYVDGAEQTERIQERSGLPDWLINVLKIFG